MDEAAAEMMNSVAVQALLASLAKRGVMDVVNQGRLRRRLTRAGVESVGEIRDFLTSCGVKPAVVRVVEKSLPPHDDQRVGPCRLLAFLTEGGMGTVWLGEYQGRLVVVKTLKPAFSEDLEYIRRFEREAKITSTLDHPNIVRCLLHGQYQGGAFMVLEYVSGGDVGTLLKRSGNIAEPESLSILLQTVTGLDQAWQRALVHRDVKPANLFIDAKGQIKVADFGLVRSSAESTSILTMQGTTVGSPAYMAPEQIRAEALDWRTDAYACGCVLFALLTGQPPFTGKISEVLAQHLSQPPPAISSLTETSPACSRLIARCLAKKPADRFPDPGVFRASLLSLLRDHGRVDASLTHAFVASCTASLLVPATADVPDDALTPTRPEAAGQATDRIRSRPRPVAVMLEALTEDLVGAGDAESDQTCISPSGREGSALRPVISSANTLGNDRDNHRFQGDWAGATPGPRLTITSPSGRTLILLGMDSAILGKLLGPPVDIALRDYPPISCALSCGRISRQHLRIGLVDGRIRVCDLGSTNGTCIDGRMLEMHEAATLEVGREHAVEIPDSVAVGVRAIPKRTRVVTSIANLPAPCADAGPGLTSAAMLDAIVMTRPKNRQELAYALVLRRLLIGPDIADLLVPGWDGAPLEVSQWNGRWIGRIGAGAWSTVTQALGDRGRAIEGRHGDLET